jgi:dihydroorotate dehydrogenase (NAD+) catalytic subunit
MIEELRRANMRVNICGLEWKNPVATAAGTFSARESGRYYSPDLLGAVTTKGVSLLPRAGNPTPRIAETCGGMLNAVGLENPGADAYIEDELKYLKARGATVISNVAGRSPDEYVEVVRRLSETDADMLEINVSCPNVSEGGMTLGVDRNAVASLTRRIKAATNKPVIVKLSPNVTDICDIAAAAEDAGADAVSLINTLTGMRIDAKSGKPVLANVFGGLSGPAVKPIALAMVYRVARRVRIPVIGMGGIMTGEDAMEFLLAGATAVAVGTAALLDPCAPPRVAEELRACVASYRDPLERF